MAENIRPLTAIVLAAGQGKRMRSTLPKPLHPVCGKPMIAWVLEAMEDVQPDRIVVVVGHGSDQVVTAVRAIAGDRTVLFAEQVEQRGTGDAVRVALEAAPAVAPDEDVIVLPGDAPLLRPGTLAALVDNHRSHEPSATMLTARVEDPTGYGRIVRGVDGVVLGVVEQADATEEQLAIDEINASMYCYDREQLESALADIGSDNAQGEIYLTDTVGVLVGGGKSVRAWVLDDASETKGVNSPDQLAAVEAIMEARRNGPDGANPRR